MLEFRGSLRRAPQQRGPVSPGCRLPFRVGRSTPQEGICKGKICNRDSKAKWLNWRGQIRDRERRRNTAAPRAEQGASRGSVAGSALPPGPLPPLPRRFWSQSRSSTLAMRVPGLPLGLHAPCCVPGADRVPARSPRGYRRPATTSVVGISDTAVKTREGFPAGSGTPWRSPGAWVF